ncbi:hypothetical protein OH77DRAFT_1499641 [Trametes cingulata]|nr:hypothetical protein OH77DRAFT_1499641 [Trametes cingulata]
MAPLGLPVERRYKAENMHLAAIIPGPREPSLEALNYYLRPVVNQMVDSWKRGVRHSRVATKSGSCVSRSAIAAAVMDLVAARKTAQLASHSAHIYRSVCNCTMLETRGRTDFECWTRRDPAKMRECAEQWRDAGSKSERDKIFQQHGVRWSELWRLPYWDPTRQLVVDSMHCIFEGLVPYHFREILGLTVANANSKDEIPAAFVHEFKSIDIKANADLDAKDEKKLSAKAISDVRLIHRALCLPVGDDLEAGLERLHKSLTGRSLKALHFVGSDLNVPETKSKMPRKDWADGLVAWKLAIPEVMSRVQEGIRETATPWLSSVPKDFGDARAGTLKADEWCFLCTVYLPLALISLWGMGASYAATKDPAFLLEVLDNTMALVSAVSVLSKRSTYRRYLAQWLDGVQRLHPERYSHRTNNHMAFHIYDFLMLFGPVYSWWCCPFERLIGHLQRIPHNGKCGESKLTMLNSYLRASKLRRWFQRSDCPAALLQVKRLFDKAFGNGNFAGASETPDALEVFEEESSKQPPSLPDDLQRCIDPQERSRAVLVARAKHNGVVYTRSSTHLGNSLVRVYGRGNSMEYGSIKYIFKVGNRVTLAMQRHLPAKGPDPFRRYADFLATVRSSELSTHLECVPIEHVVCHFARYTMPSGDVAVISLYKVRILILGKGIS